MTSGRLEFTRSWLSLLLLQALLAWALFGNYLSGRHYFAFLDIASDTYAQISAHAMLMAREFPREGWTGWSWHIGLGAPTAWMLGDAFLLLTQLGGPDHVLALRIWVYLLKVAIGGAFFLLMVWPWVQRREAALISALAYSFCGFMQVNGVWDGEGNPFVFAPMIVWALSRCVRRGDMVAFPLAVGASLLCGLFFVTVAVSLAVAFAGFVAVSESPRQALRIVALRLLPLAALGFLIGAPYTVPAALQLLDSPRVTGQSALLSRLLVEGFTPTDPHLLLIQVAGLFHKDLLGFGIHYRGYFNYLEGPVFYVGTLSLLAASQLPAGTAADRRLLRAALAGLTLYMVLPGFRLAAFGFASPYFRGTCIWPTLVLAILGARGIDIALTRGVNLRLLRNGALLVGGLFAAVALGLDERLWMAQATTILVAMAAGTAVLAWAGWRKTPPDRLAGMLAVLVVIEILAAGWPGLNVARSAVTPASQPFRDQTQAALDAIRAADPGIYRVEKAYTSVGLADAMAQDYMGVMSYYYHGRSVVAFHTAMDLMAVNGARRPVNFTNWLRGPGDRYALHSVLGVRYVISRGPLDWPGFELARQGSGWYAYRNRFALPFAVVHTRQVTGEALERAAAAMPEGQHARLKDFTLMNAVVLDAPLAGAGSSFDPALLHLGGSLDLEASYAAPATRLQRTGLQVREFSSTRVTGTIRPEADGVLVFSIPAYAGWTLRVDGKETPLMKVNYGMWGARVSAGTHQIEMSYRLPGRYAGIALGLAGLAAMAAVQSWVRRRPALAGGPAR
jgi:uncharacterized membrane protein YfhO